MMLFDEQDELDDIDIQFANYKHYNCDCYDVFETLESYCDCREGRFLFDLLYYDRDIEKPAGYYVGDEYYLYNEDFPQYDCDSKGNYYDISEIAGDTLYDALENLAYTKEDLEQAGLSFNKMKRIFMEAYCTM